MKGLPVNMPPLSDGNYICSLRRMLRLSKHNVHLERRRVALCRNIEYWCILTPTGQYRKCGFYRSGTSDARLVFCSSPISFHFEYLSDHCVHQNMNAILHMASSFNKWGMKRHILAYHRGDGTGSFLPTGKNKNTLPWRRSFARFACLNLNPLSSTDFWRGVIL